MRLIVADAGPLIALSRIRRLEVLRDLFDEVVIPSLVVTELRLDEQRPGLEALKRAIATDKWIRGRQPRITRPIAGIDMGEVAAIHLSEQLRCPLLVDERRARMVAAKRGIQTVGTGRILIEAKRRGLVDGVAGELLALRQVGYRLSDALCRQLLVLAEEDASPGKEAARRQR